MNHPVFVYDPTAEDQLSKVRGVGRYLQVLKENFPEWTFTNDLSSILHTEYSILINPFLNFVQPPQLTKRIAQKQIAVIHDLIPLKYPSHFPVGLKGKLNIYLNRLSLKTYDLIITDSYASKKDITEILGIPEEKVQVIYPCLPRIFTKSKLNSKFLNLNSKFCLYVGDATWNKNLVNLAKAIKKADVPCVFVGKVFGKTSEVWTSVNGWQRELHQFLRLAKNDDRFVLPGFVDDNELIKYYQQARLNILVSRDEGFGFSYLEAARFGTPSVLSDIPVFNEISSDTALYVNPENPDDMAEKIKRFFEDEDLRKTFAQEAKERVKFFSAEKFKEDIQTMLA